MNTTTNETIIGTAKLAYTADGILSNAVFQPSIEIDKAQISDQLGDCNGKTIEDIKQCAQLLLGAFFNKISDIELRDIEKTEIETRVTDVTHYTSTANIKTIEISFVYKQK